MRGSVDREKDKQKKRGLRRRIGEGDCEGKRGLCFPPIGHRNQTANPIRVYLLSHVVPCVTENRHLNPQVCGDGDLSAR